MEKNEKTKQDVMTSSTARESSTTFTDTELLAKNFPDLVWIVPDLIPEGMMVLAGKPKMGKSLFTLGLALSVAQGGKALGEIEVEQREVLYFALEDPERRLKDHLKKMQGDVGTSRIHFSTTGPTKTETATSFLERHIRQHPAVKLIVIDTLGRFCGYKGVASYQGSYAQIAEMKSVADKHSLTIIVIHHMRKLKGDDDLDTVMGSTGIAGAADTIALLKRHRAQSHGSFLITGREVAERELSLEFEPESLSWKLIEFSDEGRMSQERQEVLDLLRKENRDMRLKEIAEALGKKRPVLSKLLTRLIEGGFVEQPKYGFYKATPADNAEITNSGETGESSIEGEIANVGESDAVMDFDDFEVSEFTEWQPERTLLPTSETSNPYYLRLDSVDMTAFCSAEGFLEVMN